MESFLRKGKVELLALAEMKMKRTGNISWCGVRFICVGMCVSFAECFVVQCFG